ncbi:hydrogenase expression protein [Ktedonobacteria bacterium brp13]|nr:hydrogenase expression protein [Ktedonobacteria bacterium brp13]
MSFLSKISLANKSLVALVTIAILLLGGFVIPSLKQELFPSISLPTISVVAVYNGASPSIVERDVTNPLEQNLQGLQGLQTETSYSNEGVSLITLSFNYGTDINQATQTVSESLNKAQPSLPSGVTPQVRSFSIADLPIIQLSVTSDQNQQDLATALNQDVVPSLTAISGVGNVSVTGVTNQIVSINLDLNKLKADGISASQVEGALQANNISLPAGDVTTSNGQTVPIKVGNTLNSLSDLQNLIVGAKGASAGAGAGAGAAGAGATGASGFSAGGVGAGGFSAGATGAGGFSAGATAIPTPVKLKDVATVQETVAPSSSLTRTNGKESLGVSIVKTTDGNTVTISNAVNAQISSLQQKLGHNASITVTSDQAPTISKSVNDLIREGLIGAAFAILIILIFLFSIRSTLVTAVSIPLSIVIALIGLYVGNYTLNLLTLGGLTIAVGRVVDDSIVVLENIYRHLQSGEEKKVAIPNAIREVAGAVTASTLTTVAVFLPIAFTGGLVGELFRSFAVAVTVALLASLFVALTIIPVLASWFLTSPKPEKVRKEEKQSPLERGYVALVGWVTGKGWHRALMLGLAAVVLVISLALSTGLQTNLFGSSGGNSFSVSLTMPPATSLQTTSNATSKLEQAIRSLNGWKSYQSTIGSGGILSTSSGTNTATIAITTNTNIDQTAFENDLRSKMNGLKSLGAITVSGGQSSGFSSSNVQLNVQANDPQTLRQASDQVKAAVQGVSGLTDVTSNLTDGSPEIDINVDPVRAAAHGLTAAQVAQNVRLIYSGTTVTTITLNGNQQNVDLYVGTPQTTVAQIKNMLIPGTTGTVTLSDVASVVQAIGPTQITHVQDKQTATISGTVTATNVGSVTANVQKAVNKLHLPSGASVVQAGVGSSQSSTFHDLGIAVLIAIILVYCIMVATFRSLLQPLILLISIPFAATGSLILLLVTQTPLGAAALIGFLMLVGIVVTNAIVLLDLVRQYRMKGFDARSAVIEGGRHRLRPILMTAIATILALMPMALSIGGASSGFISQPLAIVVIGGLATSTVLSLLLIPTLYVIVEGIRGRAGTINQLDEIQESRVNNEEPAVAL